MKPAASILATRRDSCVSIIFVETSGFFADPISQEFLRSERDVERLCDIVGEGIDRVTAPLCWQPTGIGACAT